MTIAHLQTSLESPACKQCRSFHADMIEVAFKGVALRMIDAGLLRHVRHVLLEDRQTGPAASDQDPPQAIPITILSICRHHLFDDVVIPQGECYNRALPSILPGTDNHSGGVSWSAENTYRLMRPFGPAARSLSISEQITASYPSPLAGEMTSLIHRHVKFCTIRCASWRSRRLSEYFATCAKWWYRASAGSLVRIRNALPLWQASTHDSNVWISSFKRPSAVSRTVFQTILA